jgi:hypothetical protein
MDPVDGAIAVAIVSVSIGGLAIIGMFSRALLKKWIEPKPALEPGEAEELRHAVTRLGAEVADLQERLDFAERVLASQREGHRLEGGS